jgi:hypothetical protein
MGVSRGKLRAALAAGTVVRERHGVVRVVDETLPTAPGSWHDHARAAAAALLVLGDDSVVSHQSAGLLHRLPFPLVRDRPTDVVVTAPRHGRIVTGVHRRLGAVRDEDRDVVDGVLVTGLARTALDLARRRPLDQSLVVLDAACARAGKAALWAAYDRLTWQRDRRALGEALDAADPLSESPLESSSRGWMIRARLPEPALQVWLTDAAQRRHRVDFLWREQRVIGEADGWGKYVDLDVLREEKRREDALRDLGFAVVRWTSDELWRTPDLVMARLRRALA